MKIVEEATTSADGTRIGWERHGAGEPVLVLHGGARAARHYRALAAALAGRFSVLAVDRRGRGLSPSLGAWRGIDTEVEDVAAVMQATGATQIFGHSGGAMVALEAARRLPVRRLALYEPPVCLEKFLPLDWVPSFRAALDAGHSARAMAIFLRGLRMGPPIELPVWLLAVLARVMLLGADGREMAELLHTVPRDLEAIGSLGTDIARYRDVRCTTLLLAGARSQAYLLQATAQLERTLPDVRRADIPGADHNAPDVHAPEVVAAHLTSFFDPAPAPSAVAAAASVG
ncbi:alpha/beta hydrolase [Sorangium sp. So ce119]|uniref:alpha/beta fold hydrolase n=1 Tax=Sorangium sp. So ce119 TaxID=3133279 RepID=UPI003F5EF619